MELRDLLIEAIERAEAAGTPHKHNHILVIVNETNPHKRVSYTLKEARQWLAMDDATPELMN